MKYVPYRMLRNSSDWLRSKLEDSGELVITANDEPLAIMLHVTKDNLEELVLLLSQVRAQHAAEVIRRQAQESGRDSITMQQVDEVVNEVRRSGM